MFAKVVIFCAALAAVQAVGLVGHGLGLGYLGGPLLGKGVIAGPAAVAAHSAVINHAAPVGVGALGLAGPGYLAGAPLAYAGHGLAAPWGVGHGLAGPWGAHYGGAWGLGVGKYGLGKVW